MKRTWPAWTVAVAAAVVLATAPAASPAIVTDSFTGADGTLLENHVGEVGASWSSTPTTRPT
jgi:hypothetical protein